MLFMYMNRKLCPQIITSVLRHKVKPSSGISVEASHTRIVHRSPPPPPRPISFRMACYPFKAMPNTSAESDLNLNSDK